MKRIIISVCIFLLSAVTVLAGDVPEGLLHEDHAEVFFTEVAGYDKAAETAELRVVKQVKGDVHPGEVKLYKRLAPAGFEPEIGGVYLAAYFDEINPTYLFETTTTDTATLKLKNTDGRMWMRLQEYLNNGDFDKAEAERRQRLSLPELPEQPVAEGGGISSAAVGYGLAAVAVAAIAAAIFVVRKRR